MREEIRVLVIHFPHTHFPFWSHVVSLTPVHYHKNLRHDSIKENKIAFQDRMHKNASYFGVHVQVAVPAIFTACLSSSQETNQASISHSCLSQIVCGNWGYLILMKAEKQFNKSNIWNFYLCIVFCVSIGFNVLSFIISVQQRLNTQQHCMTSNYFFYFQRTARLNDIKRYRRPFY